jgi:GTPase SAR1 family protein
MQLDVFDAGTHDRYKALRPVFYNQLNGVILVHELANGRCTVAVARNSARV